MSIFFVTWSYLLEKNICIDEWVWGNADVKNKGGYKKMLTSADKVGGSKKGQKHANVKFEWSLILLSLSLNHIFHFFPFNLLSIRYTMEHVESGHRK